MSGPLVGAGGGSVTVLGPAVAPNSFQLVTDWYVAPITGSDANTGLTAGSPLKTIAEWRRRIWGARYGAPGFPSIVTIHALESSTVADDGYMFGYITEGSASNVVVVGIPVVIFTSTVTGFTSYAGNIRGQLVDAAIPVSWAASGLISTIATGSRFIRRVGGAGPAQASLLKDLGARTVMIGLPTDTSEISTGTPTVAIANFAVADAYQVCTRLRWPQMVTINCKARLQCLDVDLGVGVSIGSPLFSQRDQYVLCGFLSNCAFGVGIVQGFNSLWLCPSISCTEQFVAQACSFTGGTIQFNGHTDWNGSENVLLTQDWVISHGGQISTGIAHCFDNATNLIGASRLGTVDIGSIVGSGNTGKLATTNLGATIYGASLIAATTSDASPYTVGGVSYGSPVFNGTLGTGIYS